jgi:hypothetical protein
VKVFLDLLARVDVARHQEVLVSMPKFKWSREVKNLECSINYDARGFGFNRGKGKSALAVVEWFMGLVGWFLLGCLSFLLFLGFAGAFSFFFFFLVLVSFCYAYCMLRSAIMLFINFSTSL